MAQKTTRSRGPQVRPTQDIYTALVCIAFAAVVGTLGFVIYRCTELLGVPFPSFTG
ncbi:MAG: hypothetical protein ACE5EQ_08060 [Phycisphaerae bacterium]